MVGLKISRQNWWRSLFNFSNVEASEALEVVLIFDLCSQLSLELNHP